MSEEKIIEVITYKLNMNNTGVYAPISNDEIQSLLDLYNRKKAELDNLKEIEKVHQKANGNLRKKISQIKEYLRCGEIRELYLDTSNEFIGNNMNDIQEKINEIIHVVNKYIIERELDNE